MGDTRRAAGAARSSRTVPSSRLRNRVGTGWRGASAGNGSRDCGHQLWLDGASDASEMALQTDAHVRESVPTRPPFYAPRPLPSSHSPGTSPPPPESDSSSPSWILSSEKRALVRRVYLPDLHNSRPHIIFSAPQVYQPVPSSLLDSPAEARCSSSTLRNHLACYTTQHRNTYRSEWLPCQPHRAAGRPLATVLTHIVPLSSAYPRRIYSPTPAWTVGTHRRSGRKLRPASVRRQIPSKFRSSIPNTAAPTPCRPFRPKCQPATD